MRYDPNLHKAKILFQDLPTNAEYIIKVPKLHTQLVTKFTECVDAQHLQPHSLGKITFFITNQRAQRGSRKWIITKIERQGE